MKKGLTLIELIVVIGIIAILATVLFGAFSGSLESARTARCLTNLKGLASAIQMMAENRTTGMLEYPHAGCKETFSSDADGNESYIEKKGWISWYSKGVYPSSSPQASSGWSVSMYEEDEERRLYSLTNGAIWKATACNHSLFLCPSHENVKRKYKPNYSYVMNAYFGWSPNPGQDLELTASDGGAALTTRSDRRLLFAEIQFVDDEKVGLKSKVTTSGYDCDAILQYKDCTDEGSYNECLGFNHKSGKSYCANIVFMDGHVEKLLYPKKGLSQSNWQDLTKWLCEAKDVAVEGDKYVELED